MKNSSIEKILQTIEESSEFYFLYNSKLVDVDRKTNIKAKDESIASILNRLFEKKNVEYEVKGTQIILHPKEKGWIASELITEAQQQQRRQITGRIIDERGDPLIGANIIEKGTSNGTITDINGNYSLRVEEEAVLYISYIGYLDQEINTAGRTTVDVIMREDTQSLEELVVIGYGSTRKEDLSTAVSTIKFDQSIKSRPANLNSMLQGQLPGLTIQSSGGDPLAGAIYNIRGKGSRDSDGILWVVDGVPGGIYNIEDVESITILKDAASAAIYGASVGSGGVIVITTKRAQSGKVRVEANVSHSFQNPWRLPQALTSEELNQVWKDAVDASITKRDLPLVADSSRYPYGNVTRTDWIDEVFRTGHLHHYAVSLSGGTESLKGYGSFSYDKNEGILINTYSEKMGAKINLDFQIREWLNFSQRGTFQYSNGQGDVWNNSHEGVLIGAIFYPRAATVYERDEEGNLMYDSMDDPLFGGTIPRWAVDKGVSGYGEIRNPVAELERLRQYRPSANFSSTSSIEIKPIDNLTLRSDFTASLSSSRYEGFYPIIYEYGRPNPENSKEISSTWRKNWLWETTASYAKVFDKHHISALGGYTMRRIHSRWNNVWTYGYDREDPFYTITGNANDWGKTKPGESIWDESMISMLGRIGYSYADRYFITTSLRRDVTSKLAPENNSGVFPAVSGSWKISSESFFNNSLINLLKVRASWGQVGNCDLVPRYSYIAQIVSTGWPAALGENLDQAIYGKYLSTLINRNLTWETTEQSGVGLDVALLSNSLNFSTDYFYKVTKDLIDSKPLPPAAGYPSEPRGNVGRVLNTGWEFSADYRKTINRFTFNLFGNCYFVKSEVKDLGSRDILEHGTTINGQKPLRSKVGEPWYSYAVIKTDGIYQTWEDINNHIYTNPETGETTLIRPNARPGDLKYVDYNNDGIINDEDRQYMGSYLPKASFGFGGGFEYNGFDFQFFFQGIAGVKIYNGFRMMGLTGRQQGNNMLADVLDSWTYDKSSDIPRLSLFDDANGNFGNVSDFFLEDGSYLRLKNVTLGYILPQNIMQNIGMGDLRLRLYMGAENLFTFTKYTGFDPEVSNNGIDAGAYPVSRKLNIGINVNF
ncbi:MAG: TonB-dependent receptor [Proteiniphilum sp.]